MSKQYEIMEPIVEAICLSLETEPHKWVLEAHSLHHRTKFNRIELWIGNYTFIIYKWEHAESTQIFSEEQGKRIYASYILCKIILGNNAQQRLLASLTPKPTLSEQLQSVWKSFLNLFK